MGLTDKQIVAIQDRVSFNDINRINNSIVQQAKNWIRPNAELIESIEASKENMILRQAEANAEAYAKVLRTSPFLFDEVVGALASLCGNPSFNSSSLENQMNDYIRDILGRGLQVRDQTRQGISGNSSSAEKGRAGELDIQIRNNGRPIGIYEGLRLDGVNSKDIYDHIKKATINYNPQGVKEVFIVAYVRGYSTGFGGFWNSFIKCVKGYQASDTEYEIQWDDAEEDTGLSAVRSLHGIYFMDDVEHNVHIMAVKLMK